MRAVLNRCLPKARPDCIEKPERQVSTLVAFELGVANGSNAAQLPSTCERPVYVVDPSVINGDRAAVPDPLQPLRLTETGHSTAIARDDRLLDHLVRARQH